MNLRKPALNVCFNPAPVLLVTPDTSSPEPTPVSLARDVSLPVLNWEIIIFLLLFI